MGAGGETLGQLERFSEAEAALLEAQEVLAAALGADHERSIRAINALVEFDDVWPGA